MEAEEKMDERLLDILKKEFEIKEADIYSINGPLDLTMLMKVYGLEGFDKLQELRNIHRQPVPEFSEWRRYL